MSRLQNLSSFPVGTKTCARRPPESEATIVVRGTFDIIPDGVVQRAASQGALTGDVYGSDDEQRTGGLVYASDFADFKLNGDVLLSGRCHTPNGAALTDCPVRFSVGAWSKTLRVVGQRVWSDLVPRAAMSRPVPFTSMPLGWGHAFGGPGFERNPSGKGFQSKTLPTVESASSQVRAFSDTPEPAGFGPINPRWPSRRAKVGKAYGKQWRETRAPYVSEDFDWSYFNAAPTDQQVQGYLRGDEELVFVNLHPTARELRTRLPGLRVRAFVLLVGGAFHEVPMVLDTLHADTDAGEVKLTWRGVAPVRETDQIDLQRLLVVREKLDDPKLSVDHYRRLLDEVENDRLVGIDAVMPAHVVAELKKTQTENAGLLENLDFVDLKRRQQATGKQSPQDLSSVLAEKLGPLGKGFQEKLTATVDRAREKAAPSKGRPGIDFDAKLAEALAAAFDQPPVPKVLKVGTFPDMRLRDRMRKIMAMTEQMKRICAEAKVAIPERLIELEKLPHHPKLKLLDPEYEVPGPISTEEPGPGRDLREQDLSGRDLTGMDLTGAKLDGALLVKTKLAGAKLGGASLRKAVLYKADLTGADLGKADLTKVNAAQAILRGANLAGALLDLGYFEGADLTEANLDGATGEYVVLIAAKLDNARARAAKFRKSDASQASMTRADFSGADLFRMGFTEVKAAGAHFRGAAIGNARFLDADLTGASFVEARGERAVFRKARLDGACLTLAVLPRGRFHETSMQDVVAYGINLAGSQFYRANMERANFSRANFFRTAVIKSRLSGATFRDASLYGSMFRGSSGRDCDLVGAVLTASSLERA